MTRGRDAYYHSQVGKAMTKSGEVFGGIQVIASADLFQLASVSNRAAHRFAFEAEAWRESVQQVALLTGLDRQKIRVSCMNGLA